MTTPKGQLEDEVGVKHLACTIYRHLGFDPASTITDNAGRPRYLVDGSREEIPGVLA